MPCLAAAFLIFASRGRPHERLLAELRALPDEGAGTPTPGAIDEAWPSARP